MQTDKPALYGLVLEGGLSSRMGKNKAYLTYHKRPQREHAFGLLEKFCHRVYYSAGKQAPPDVHTIVDAFPFQGPLNGILSAFKRYPGVAWLTLPVDMPLVDEGVIRFLVAHRDAAKAATDGKGADVVVDVVGGEFTEKAIRAIAWRGRLLVIGFAAGAIPRLATNLTLLKGCHVIGVFWDEMLRREPGTSRPQIDALTAAWADGRLRPPVTRTYPLARAGEALQQLAGRRTPGKLLVVP